jgi:hypothetical protein
LTNFKYWNKINPQSIETDVVNYTVIQVTNAIGIDIKKLYLSVIANEDQDFDGIFYYQ